MLKKLFNTELGKGAVVLFITMNIFNFLNFLFHFAMARTLGPSDYGVLAVLMSIIYVYSVPTEAIQTIISRYTSKFNLAREYGKMKFLLFRTLKKGVGFSLAIFAISILASFPISIFLKINFWLILLTNLFVFYAITGPIIKGVIQGRKQFGLLGINLIMESAIRLALAIFLVALGFGVFGAMIGVLIGVAMSLIISLYFSRDIIQVKEEPTYIGGMRSESISYFLTMFVIFSMFSIDIILAKRFFLPDVAGKYAVLSMLGKMIFLGTVAISKAMFPLASEKHDGKEDSSGLLVKSLLMTFGLCAVAIIAYALIPKLIIRILYGSAYLEIFPLLIYSGIAFSFLALSNLILVYALSTRRLRNPAYLFVFLILEILLLFFFSETMREYVLAFMVSNIVMFIGSIFFLRKQ